MTASGFASRQPKLAFTRAIRDFLAVVDEETYERVLAAAALAEALLPQLLKLFDVPTCFLMAHKNNIVLCVKYVRAKERFAIVAIVDANSFWLPPDGPGTLAGQTLLGALSTEVFGAPISSWSDHVRAYRDGDESINFGELFIGAELNGLGLVDGSARVSAVLSGIVDPEIDTRTHRDCGGSWPSESTFCSGLTAVTYDDDLRRSGGDIHDGTVRVSLSAVTNALLGRHYHGVQFSGVRARRFVRLMKLYGSISRLGEAATDDS